MERGIQFLIFTKFKVTPTKTTIAMKRKVKCLMLVDISLTFSEVNGNDPWATTVNINILFLLDFLPGFKIAFTYLLHYLHSIAS